MKTSSLFQKYLLFLAFSLLTTLPSMAQVDLGLRFGEPSGLDLKFGLNKKTALNVVAGGNFRGRNGYGGGYTVMVAHHWLKSTNTTGLNWYWGLGGLVASRDYYWDGRERDRYTALALVVPFGLDYKINGAPVVLFGELTPGADVVPAGVFLGASLGVRLRLSDL